MATAPGQAGLPLGDGVMPDYVRAFLSAAVAQGKVPTVPPAPATAVLPPAHPGRGHQASPSASGKGKPPIPAGGSHRSGSTSWAGGGKEEGHRVSTSTTPAAGGAPLPRSSGEGLGGGDGDGGEGEVVDRVTSDIEAYRAHITSAAARAYWASLDAVAATKRASGRVYTAADMASLRNALVKWCGGVDGVPWPPGARQHVLVRPGRSGDGSRMADPGDRHRGKKDRLKDRYGSGDGVRDGDGMLWEQPRVGGVVSSMWLAGGGDATFDADGRFVPMATGSSLLEEELGGLEEGEEGALGGGHGGSGGGGMAHLGGFSGAGGAHRHESMALQIEVERQARRAALGGKAGAVSASPATSVPQAVTGMAEGVNPATMGAGWSGHGAVRVGAAVPEVRGDGGGVKTATGGGSGGLGHLGGLFTVPAGPPTTATGEMAGGRPGGIGLGLGWGASPLGTSGAGGSGLWGTSQSAPASTWAPPSPTPVGAGTMDGGATRGKVQSRPPAPALGLAPASTPQLAPAATGVDIAVRTQPPSASTATDMGGLGPGALGAGMAGIMPPPWPGPWQVGGMGPIPWPGGMGMLMPGGYGGDGTGSGRSGLPPAPPAPVMASPPTRPALIRAPSLIVPGEGGNGPTLSALRTDSSSAGGAFNTATASLAGDAPTATAQSRPPAAQPVPAPSPPHPTPTLKPSSVTMGSSAPAATPARHAAPAPAPAPLVSSVQALFAAAAAANASGSSSVPPPPHPTPTSAPAPPPGVEGGTKSKTAPGAAASIMAMLNASAARSKPATPASPAGTPATTPGTLAAGAPAAPSNGAILPAVQALFQAAAKAPSSGAGSDGGGMGSAPAPSSPAPACALSMLKPSAVVKLG